MGYFHFLWDADKSKISFGVVGLFVFGWSKLGYHLYKDSLNEKSLDTGYELADHSMALGMLGTVVGFIIMLGSLKGADLSPESIKALFSVALSGMGTSLYTTAVGLISATILRAAYHSAYEEQQNV